jgi:hypothetical protein
MSNPYFDVKVEFEARGYNRVRNQLRTLATAHPEITDKVMERHIKTQAANLRTKAYPPRLPNQKYIRTGKLGGAFRAQRRGRGSWAVINRTSYAVYVIKKGYQNRQYHAGRWWTIEDEMNRSMPELTRKLSTALEQELDRQ